MKRYYARIMNHLFGVPAKAWDAPCPSCGKPHNFILVGRRYLCQECSPTLVGQFACERMSEGIDLSKQDLPVTFTRQNPMNTNPFSALLDSKVSYIGATWRLEDAHDTRCFFKCGDERIRLSPQQVCSLFQQGNMTFVELVLNCRLIG